MNLWDLLKMGLRNLSRRKARTALTVVGVIIGTVSIVSMVSIGFGINETFEKTYMENGAMTIIQIEQYSSNYDEQGNWLGESQQILDDALLESLKGIEHIKAIAPVIDQQAELKSGKFTSGIQLRAIGKDAFKEFGYPELTFGTYPVEGDINKIVFSNQALANFYYYAGRKYETKAIDPTEEKMTFAFSSWNYQKNPRKKDFKIEFTPVSGNFAVMGESDNWEYNYHCYIDMDYFKEIWKKYASTLTVADRKKAMQAIETYNTVYVNVDNIENVTEVQDKIKELGYGTYSDMQYLEPLQQTSNMIQVVLGAIGALAMLVSAINIANTMVMSIYERTREIGIMKVLGCKVFDIRRLFLYEAALIGFMGGVIGIILSYGVSFAINKYGQPLFSAIMQTSYVYDVEGAKFSIIPIWLPFAAAVFGMLVGVVSGYIPARRATKISAIEAMKSNQ